MSPHSPTDRSAAARDATAFAYGEIDFPEPGPATGERLRLSFRAPLAVLETHAAAEVPALLAAVEAHARAGGWALGFVAYEAAGAFDAALATRPPGEAPLATFALFGEPAAAPRPRGDFLPGVWRDETGRERFDEAVAAIRAGIAAGDYYQVNYTTRLAAPFRGDAAAFFDALRANQPAAHCAFLDFDRWQVCSVSPELFFDWGADGTLKSRPMKGTAARDADPARDAAAARELRASPKECAENLMIVDLIRNDLSRVARLGTVAVAKLFEVEAWPTVWQMTSTVSCTTCEDATLHDVFAALFPCGSVTGAPKPAAMQAIAALETSPRGAYCGAVGLVRPGGAATFAVGIRTVVVDAHRGTAECGIGSGITLDSDAAAEYTEWQAKTLFLRRACPDYDLLETLRLHRGRWWLLAGHQRRLEGSARELGFAFDHDAIAAALRTAVGEHPAGDWRVRLTLSPSGRVRTEAFPLECTPTGALIALAASPVSSADPWLRHKTTRRDTYESRACGRPGIFDTLLFNERGELTEFSRGNVVVELDGERLTPPLACGLLPGVLREALLARGRIREAIVTAADLDHASRIWFVNSVRGGIPVTAAAEPLS
jgi:para-aminobenzoate synthetase/4-amino-4-deoxychorismate lyase